MSRTRARTTRRWKIWGFSQEVASGPSTGFGAGKRPATAGRRVASEPDRAAHAGDVGRGAGMVARKAGRNLRGRNAGSRRALGSDRAEANLWEADQPGP